MEVNDWGAFRLGDLFEVRKGKRLTKEDQTEGDTPHVGAIDSNNGVSNRIGQEAIHEGGTISLSRIGIGEDKAVGLIAAFELGRRAVDAERNMRNRAMPIGCAADVFALLKPEADKQEREVFWCLMLDLRKRLIANPVVVSAGTKDAALVIPRDVFRPAIREGAVAIIAAHNHLSEDISPSDEDIELTRLLKETGDTVGIPLIDHVILSSVPSCGKWRSIT